jgi:hypothetical protein
VFLGLLVLAEAQEGGPEVVVERGGVVAAFEGGSVGLDRLGVAPLAVEAIALLEVADTEGEGGADEESQDGSW